MRPGKIPSMQRWMIGIPVRVGCIVAFSALLSLGAGPIAAQDPDADEVVEKAAEDAVDEAVDGAVDEAIEEAAKEFDLEALHEMVLQQKAIIEAQQEELELQAKALLLMQAQIDELKSQPEELTPEEVAIRERLQAVETQMQAQANDVENIDEDFPGSLHIPGTNMAFKAGGFVNLTMVSSVDPIEQGDRFVTAGIPVTDDDPGEPGTEVTVNRTRLNFDWRMKSRFGQFRSFVEGDFRGDNQVFRLRHAFGQFKNLTLGQTWTTFTDTRNRPEEIDLEGLNGQVMLRQALGRYDFETEGKLRWSLALENPDADITGAIGEVALPDFVARMVWENQQHRSHVAFLARSIVGESTETEFGEQREFGWGISGGTRVPVVAWDPRDHLLLQASFGQGVGRYIQDLRAEGGQDAVFDLETGQLEVLLAGGGYFSFQHWWAETIRSTFSLGWAWVDNVETQGDDAYHQTVRFSLNGLWSPIPNIDLGAEVLYGIRKNKNNERGNALQFQFASYFRF